VHVIIAGCGRVGSQLALTLDADGHDVVVVDKNAAAFRRLGEDFGGSCVGGFVFDKATLERAGIKRAQAFVAVTSGDNSNIVSARTAKEAYGVDHVVARIYDPDRAVIYERHGITTIASARWTTEAILRSLLPQNECVLGGIGPGEDDVVLLSAEVPGIHQPIPAAKLNRPGEAVLAAFSRDGQTRVPGAGTLLQEGDRLHLAVQRDAVETVRGAIARLSDNTG
jgi:trk system potassium uptake protein TrkA